MPEHSLPEGKRWIENLLRLGRALGYHAVDEYDVATDNDEPAPVDVAWLRSPSDEFPLFIFEVESRPSGQLTYNAAKVFSQETGLFQKPLFHFHVVLEGGIRSGRLKAAQRVFGSFNYRVYAAGERATATEALRDVFSQHRRVESRVEVAAIANALETGAWPDVDIDGLWEHIEDCGFDADFEVVYARRALAEQGFKARLVRRLIMRSEAADDHAAQYPGLLPSRAVPVLAAAVLGLLARSNSSRAVARLRAWQASAEGLHPRGDDHTERERDLVTALAPCAWAAVAAAHPDNEDLRGWILEQLEPGLGDVRQRMPLPFSACSAVWMLHTARTGGVRHLPMYNRAAEHLRDLGGVPRAMLSAPPGSGPRMGQLDEWELNSSPGPTDVVPDWNALTSEKYDPLDCGSDLADELMAVMTLDRPIDGVIVLRALWSSHGG